jgi:hypothetical protein
MLKLIKWLSILILSVICKEIRFDIENELSIYSEYKVVYYIFKEKINYLVKTFKSNIIIDIPYLKAPYSYRRKLYFSNKQVTDIVRCMIVYENEGDILSFVKILEKNFWILREKNNLNDNQRYKVYQMLVSLKLFPDCNIEVQLMLKNLYYITKSTHDIYKILRISIILQRNYKNHDFIIATQIDPEHLYIPYNIYLKLENKTLSLFDIFLYEINYHLKEIEPLRNMIEYLRNDMSQKKIDTLVETVESYLYTLYDNYYKNQ